MKRPIILTGPALALARRRVGVSQTALAHALGLHAGIIADWERGHDPLPPEWHERLARALLAARLAQAQREADHLLAR